MKIIISPAKKMNIDDEFMMIKKLPVFINKTEELKKYIQGLSRDEAKAIWKCNDKLTDLNYERFKNMNLTKAVTPAVISYEGLQYQYMAPSVMEYRQHEYIDNHLRIISGFYGILSPFDGVVPYRLEMQAKINMGNIKSLYEFWGNMIYKELTKDGGSILNLASKEYSKAIEPYLNDGDRFVTCVFGELKDGKVVSKGTEAKMARGEMVNFLSYVNAKTTDDAKAFNRLGYKFSDELSSDTKYVFLKN